jgi:hypothetical protein
VTWTRAHAFAAGAVLVALTNAVALGGAAWNRSGEESRLRLTQRELVRPYVWYGNRENSGMSLVLTWRVLGDLTPSASYLSWNFAATLGAPAWLDRAKMEELGFRTTGAASAEGGRSPYEKQLPRDVLIVLEMDGPAWQRYIQAGRDQLAREEARTASPDEKGAVARLRNARDTLERELLGGSRLFAVDAGLDAAALRAKYPDRERYAIVRGQIRPMIFKRGEERYTGMLTDVSASKINVPLEFRQAIPDVPDRYQPNAADRAPFEATIAFGKRFEPWVAEAAKK